MGTTLVSIRNEREISKDLERKGLGVNHHQRNSIIARNENLNPPEYHDYSDNCGCPNCQDLRSNRCECGVELKSDEMDDFGDFKLLCRVL